MPRANISNQPERKLEPADARELFQVLDGVEVAGRLVTQWLDHEGVDELQYRAERYLETIKEKDKVETKLKKKMNPAPVGKKKGTK